jgi:hypothetical protein
MASIRIELGLLVTLADDNILAAKAIVSGLCCSDASALKRIFTQVLTIHNAHSAIRITIDLCATSSIVVIHPT